MKVSQLVAAGVLPLVTAYNPFKSSSPDSTQSSPFMIDGVEQSEFDDQFDLIATFHARSRQSDIYTQAMAELKQVEEEPLCYRLAVQMLMSSCKNLGDASDDRLNSALLQNHEVQSFANALSLCDLNLTGNAVSDACAPFKSSALLHAYRLGNGKLEVSTEQTLACIKSLGKEDRPLNIWIHSRDKALLFCRAVRVEIEKDQTILLHKKLTKIMAEFGNGLEIDLQRVKAKMAEHTRDVQSYFEGFKAESQKLKFDVRKSFEVISKDTKDISSAMKSIKYGANDVLQVFKTSLQVVFGMNAEMASTHEEALATTSDTVKSGLEGINNLVGETQGAISRLVDTMDRLVPAFLALSEQQNDLEQRFASLHATLNHTTQTLQEHTAVIERTSSTASGLSQSMEKAAAAAKSLQNTGVLGGSWDDLILRTVVLGLGLMFGTHNQPSSLSRNFNLLVIGLVTGQLIVQARHLEYIWTWTWKWNSDPLSPTALTHLAREKVGATLSLNPVGPSFTLATTESGHSTIRVDMA